MNAVSAITHTTVDGKKEYYIKGVNVITGEEHYFPVGKKTHDGIKALGGCTITDATAKKAEVTELPFPDEAAVNEYQMQEDAVMEELAPLMGGDLVIEQKDNATKMDKQDDKSGRRNR